jgi:hypothetical protein
VNDSTHNRQTRGIMTADNPFYDEAPFNFEAQKQLRAVAKAECRIERKAK